MLNYLKRRFSSTELINEFKSGVGYGTQQSHQQTASNQKPTQDYKYLPEEVRRQTVEEMYKQVAADSEQTRGARMAFPSAPSSPTKQSSMGIGGGSVGSGFMNTVTGQLTKAKHLFSTETLNSIIADVKVPGVASGPKSKILLVIDHPLTDWAKYLHKRKIDGDWEVRVEQAQMNDISITAYPDQGCVVTVQDGRGARSAARMFKPDFVLIRQGLGAATQHYENLITGFMFGAVPCMNSIEAVYNMRNKAWLFSNLLKIQKRLGAYDFPLIARSYQAKSQPLVPDFQMPVNVRLGGDSARECEVRVEDTALFQSLMSLANNTQRYATVEPCVQSICEILIQKIGPFTKAFMRKPISNPSLGSPGSTVLEKIPVSPRFNQWITEVSQMFGGLDMCAIKVLQNSTGDYFIQDVYGSDFILLGDGQEEDRARIAELLLQRMEFANKAAPGAISQPYMSQPPTKPTQAPAASPPVQMGSGSQSVFSTTTPVKEKSMQPTFGQNRQQQIQPSSFSLQEQQQLPKSQPPPSGPSPSQSFRESQSGRSNVSGGTMDFSQVRAPLQPQQKTQSPFEPQLTRNEFTNQESFDKSKTASTRTTSMDFSSYPQPKRTNYSRESDESLGMSTSTPAAASIPTFEPRTSDSWTSGSGGRAIREPSAEGPEYIRGRPQKEAAPQPPRQSSFVNSFETRAFDSCGSGTTSSISASNTNTLDPSMNIFQPQMQGKSSMSTFQSQSQERDTSGSVKFDTSSMDFGQSQLGSRHNDPWSVPSPPASVNQTSQIASTLTTSSSSSATTTSMAARSRQTSQQSSGNPDDADDTMKNLRKTFAADRTFHSFLPTCGVCVIKAAKWKPFLCSFTHSPFLCYANISLSVIWHLLFRLAFVSLIYPLKKARCNI
uniref:Synapsin n=1 Tax=Echinococcus granulosus TaxID=6210 RepID=A0A068WY58_ECHGR|nr:synapsin [Echinococcus granulosus]